MKRPLSTQEIEFEKATRDWIVGRMGLAGFYEISRMKRLENEGLLHDNSNISVEFATILSMMREKNGAFAIPSVSRREFDVLVHKERQTRSLLMEGERNLVFESEGERRLSRYSKLFKVFQSSKTLSEFDTRVFSSLYDQVRHFSGGRIGPMLFYRLEGETEKGHELLVYLFCERPLDFSENPSAIMASPSVPKRIFAKVGGRLHEKDPLLAVSGLLKIRRADVTKSGIALSHR